jgi:AraC-like DNA-binding protein
MSLVTALVNALASPEELFRLFDFLPRVYLFVKDAESRFVRVNEAMLQLKALQSQEEIVGKTDFDFHPPLLAAQYVEEDRRVMKSGQPLRDQVWLVMGADRMPRWYLSSKLPLHGPRRKVVGLAGVLRPYDGTGPSPGDYHRLTPVMEHVLAHHGTTITVSELARIAHLSVSQLQREFIRLFGMSPMDYLIRVRLLIARRRMEETDEPIGNIAVECGFHDQSHFTRYFRERIGMTPGDYRNRFRNKRTSLAGIP